MDYIFLLGPSAVGKTTLARKLYLHYNGVYLEQNMVPEFAIPDRCADEGIFEEQVCWDNVLLQLRWFHEQGFQNIVALDFDDLRVRELPLLFRGYRFILLRLVSSDTAQIRKQMIYRHSHEGGLFCPENIDRSNAKIMSRKLLPNEVMIDVAGKTKDAVFDEAVSVIDSFEPLLHYDYEPDAECHYLSWVQSRHLS